MNNKNILKIIFLILLVISGITEGCKKYEDGPWLSLRSATKRLYGNYTIKQYTVNGQDSLSLYYENLSLNFELYYDDVNSFNVCHIDGKRKDGQLTHLGYIWELNANKKFFIIKSANGDSYGLHYTGPFGDHITPKWEIIRLTNNEVKMRTTYNEKEYLIELKSN